MNGDTDASSSRTGAPRKPRPEIQIYRPGMLRQGGSTKSLSSTNEEARPPRPEKLNTTTTTMSGNSRRRSNDTDSVTSRGGSGSTTPDANVINAMNERGGGRNRFEKGYRQQQRTDGPSNYNSTQSLYDTRQHGGYMEYQGNHRSNHRNNGRYSNQQHQQHRQPFERPGGNHYTRGFNERASMRGDGAIARRPQGSRRQRNDSINSYNPRVLYQRTRGANDENHPKRRDAAVEKKPKEPRRYRGEHDDRDDDASEYHGTLENHMSSGRLAGRIQIVQRSQNGTEAGGNRNRQSSEEKPRTYQKRSQNQSEMANRAEINRRRQEDIDRNEGKQIREISEKIEKLSAPVKKRDLKSAEKMAEISMELANIYSQVIIHDVIYSFTAGLEQKLFRQAFYKCIESLRTGSNSAAPDARLIRAVTQKLLLNGIVYYENLIATYETQFHVALTDALTWQSGSPSDEELCEQYIELPIGIQKFDSATQKTAIKSLSRHLISLGDLHRYKSLIDGSENYEISKSCYQKSSQLWPSTGHPYNQLGIVVYYSMLYRSARRARLVPVDVLSRQRQKRVIDEFFCLTRALACSHPYEVAKDRLKQRIDAMRTKVAKYQPVLDKESGIVKEQGNVLRRLQRIRQIWIHPITETSQDGTGERIVDDVLVHFMEHSKAKLHRRAVSYLCDTFGMLVTKIGMDHFESVSERAFGLLYASLSKSETDFSADQLVKFSAMFIYAAQVNFDKSTPSTSKSQLHTAVRTIFTYFLVLLEHISTHTTLLLPAANVIATWILHADTEELLSYLEHLEPLSSTIISSFSNFPPNLESEAENPENVTTPEAILLASFFKIYEPNPTPVRCSRSTNISQAVEKLKILGFSAEKSEKSGENGKQKLGDGLEEPKSREQMIDEQRGLGKTTIVIHPEYLIPDTNVLIGDLQLMKNLQAKQKTGHLYTLTTTGKRLPTLSIVSEDLEGHEMTTNDDMILNSALRWSESLPGSTAPSATEISQKCVLITGDRGLTIKAIGNNFPCRGISNFTKWIINV
eukprot:NP_001040885.1 Suppressor with Morphological effect on Genitalia [Caenorhabditis elegans]